MSPSTVWCSFEKRWGIIRIFDLFISSSQLLLAVVKRRGWLLNVGRGLIDDRVTSQTCEVTVTAVTPDRRMTCGRRSDVLSETGVIFSETCPGPKPHFYFHFIIFFFFFFFRWTKCFYWFCLYHMTRPLLITRKMASAFFFFSLITQGKKAWVYDETEDNPGLRNRS